MKRLLRLLHFAALILIISPYEVQAAPSGLNNIPTADTTPHLAFDRDLMLRSDAIQIDRQHNWAASIGGLYAFHKYFVFETWMTHPIHDLPPSFTVKFNLVIPFADLVKN